MATKTMFLRGGALSLMAAAVLGAVVLAGIWSAPARTQTTPVILSSAAPPFTALAPTDNTQSAFGLPCGLTASATAQPGALVALDISDPCRPETRIDITHAGLSIAAQTDATGLLTLDFPGLETPAFFTIRNAKGQETVAMAGLPDLAGYTRAAIFWDGDLALELHAFEAGAEFGASGHVWKDSPGTLANALAGVGGFLTVLGDTTLTSPRLAQIYSIPQSLMAETMFSVDIPITATSCGRLVRAQSVLRSFTTPPDIVPIALTLPECDGVGGYLLLQNLFAGLRLVSD